VKFGSEAFFENSREVELPIAPVFKGFGTSTLFPMDSKYAMRTIPMVLKAIVSINRLFINPVSLLKKVKIIPWCS
jgi:hypothetical protein